NAPRGTQRLFTNSCLRGLAGGNACEPVPGSYRPWTRLCCVLSAAALASCLPPGAAVRDSCHTCPVDAAIAPEVVPDPPAFAPAASVTELPGSLPTTGRKGSPPFVSARVAGSARPVPS